MELWTDKTIHILVQKYSVASAVERDKTLLDWLLFGLNLNQLTVYIDTNK